MVINCDPYLIVVFVKMSGEESVQDLIAQLPAEFQEIFASAEFKATVDQTFSDADTVSFFLHAIQYLTGAIKIPFLILRITLASSASPKFLKS